VVGAPDRRLPSFKGRAKKKWLVRQEKKRRKKIEENAANTYQNSSKRGRRGFG